MARFKVTQDYSSSGGKVDGSRVVLEVGSVVELDDELAAYIERDAPGTLQPTSGKERPPKDRQVKAAQNRGVSGEDRLEDAAPIDGSVYKGIKEKG